MKSVSYSGKVLLPMILGFVTWTSIIDNVSAQTSCVINPDLNILTIRDNLGRDVELHCQCMDDNGIISETRWFLPDMGIVSTDDSNRPYSNGTTPSRLIFTSPFNNSDTGTYTCSPNDTFPTIPPGDNITLTTAADPESTDDVNCSIVSTNLPTVTAAGGVIANGTQNVILYCICMRVNSIVTVGRTRWFFDGTRITLTQDDGSGNPYFIDNVPSTLTIPSFVTPHDGNYSCSHTIDFIDVAILGDTITLTLPDPTPNVSVTTLNTQTVGQSLTLQCEVTAVRGSTGRVDIVWSSGGTELQRMNNVSSTMMSNSLVYTNSYTISLLSTTNDSNVIQCKVVINASPPVMATDGTTLDVTVPTPTVMISPSGAIRGAMVGNPQVINCTVSTVSGVESSSVMISWMGPGGAITSISGRISIGSVTNDGNNMYTRSLQFTYLKEGDEGTYTCNVMILDTSESQSVELQSLIALTAPGNFRYTSVTANSIIFQWDSLTQDAQVTWYVITCSEENNIFMANVTGINTMGIIDGLSPFTNYSCTVHAVIMTSASAMSDPIVVRTAEAAPSPPIINEITAIDSTSVRMQWSVPNNLNGILTTYTILYNIEGGNNITVNVPYNGQPTQSYDITGLSPYQLVTVIITATNGEGTSNPSAARDGRSSEAAAGVVKIASIVGTSETSAIVFWTAPLEQNGAITGYQITYSLYEDSTNSMNRAVTSNEDSFIIRNLIPGMLYQVDVVAFNSRGRGATSKPRSFYSQELLPTQSIQNVIFDRSGEYVGISWDALALSEARGFPVYTVTLTPSTSNEKQIITGVISMNTTESSIVVGDLDANTEYMLTVGVGTTAGQVTSDRVYTIMKPTSQTTSNDNGNSNSVIFLILFAVSAVINILLTIIIIYLVIRARKSGYSPNNAAHIYDAVEMRLQYTKPFSNPDHTTSSSKIIPTRSEQDMKADNVKLQENPAYAATNEYY